MRLSLDETTQSNQISHYHPDKITVNKRDYKKSLLICANKLLSPWTEHDAAQLTADDFTLLLNCKPTIIIIGTGEKLTHLDPALIADIQQQGIGLEVMDTAAACRTYNVLLSEGRDVVAGLLL